LPEERRLGNQASLPFRFGQPVEQAIRLEELIAQGNCLRFGRQNFLDLLFDLFSFRHDNFP
jgi:hypothetical protein